MRRGARSPLIMYRKPSIATTVVCRRRSLSHAVGAWVVSVMRTTQASERYERSIYGHMTAVARRWGRQAAGRKRRLSTWRRGERAHLRYGWRAWRDAGAACRTPEALSRGATYYGSRVARMAWSAWTVRALRRATLVRRHGLADNAWARGRTHEVLARLYERRRVVKDTRLRCQTRMTRATPSYRAEIASTPC